MGKNPSWKKNSENFKKMEGGVREISSNEGNGRLQDLSWHAWPGPGGGGEPQWQALGGELREARHLATAAREKPSVCGSCPRVFGLRRGKRHQQDKVEEEAGTRAGEKRGQGSRRSWEERGGSSARKQTAG